MERVTVTLTGQELKRCLHTQRLLLAGLKATLERKGDALLKTPIVRGAVDADLTIDWPPRGLPVTKGCDVALKNFQAMPIQDVAASLRYLDALLDVLGTALGGIADDQRFTAQVDAATG
jgi:hypothetical protein